MQSLHPLNEQLALQTLKLCSIPSTTGNESAIIDEIERQCNETVGKLNAKRLGNALLAWGSKKLNRPTITLLGHVDTVLPAKEQPLCINETQGLVYGLGASDMKGGLAVMLALLSQSESFAGANLQCLFYDREEGPAEQNGLEALMQAGWLLGTDLALCLEPTDNQLQAGCVGGLYATVTFFGQRAHSARPWQGKNAIYQALPYLQRLKEFGKKAVQVQGLVFYEVMNVTQAHAGTSRNVIPDEFSLTVNYRFSPGKSMEQAISELQAVVQGEGHVQITDRSPSGKVCLDHPLVQAWQKDQGLEMVAKQAWTDVARLTQYGIPAVNYGPGETAQAHQSNESIPIRNLITGYEHLYRLLRGLL